jgi:hypothetical protein
MEFPEPEAEHEFQKWSATTTGLVLDAVRDRVDNVQDDLNQRRAQINRSIVETIGFGSTSNRQGFTKQLDDILDAAFAVDKDISRQIAVVEWVFDFDILGETNFDPDTMELDRREMLPPGKETHEVRLVVAPALMKRGRPTGEDFDELHMLLKMVVYCD